jgi:hypothetical protein
MGTVIVRTKKELQNAVESQAEKIVVKGELAEKLNQVLKIKKSTIPVLVAPLCCAPFTGGFSVFAAAPVAVLTGFEIAVILAVFLIGLALIIAICKDFPKIRFTAKYGDIEAELVLERNAAAC